MNEHTYIFIYNNYKVYNYLSDEDDIYTDIYTTTFKERSALARTLRSIIISIEIDCALFIYKIIEWIFCKKL